VPVKDLAFYDVDAGAWVVEAITYTVSVGSSSTQLPLHTTFVVKAA